MSADPLSIASVLAFIQACGEGIKIAKAMKNANKEEKIIASELEIEIRFLETLGEQLERIMKEETVAGSITSSSTFKELTIYMEKVRSPLVSFVEKYNASEPPRIKRFWGRVTWLYRKEQLQDLLSKIRHCKSSITTALDVCHVEISQAIRKEQGQIRVRKDIMKWLEPGSWDINYAATVGQSKAGTHFLESKAFSEIKNSKGGALKFVPCDNTEEGNAIFASIIRALQAEFGAAPNTAILYYSFGHNPSAKGDIPMISALVAQLCQDLSNIPPEVITLYKDNSSQAQKSSELLFQIFSILARQFERIYVVMNATTKDSNAQQMELSNFKKWTKITFPSTVILICQASQPLSNIVQVGSKNIDVF
ncbi:hypothetical protein M422DRAFT_272415 [Sphaerobolus stellatus SS14]|uniref:Nephrocystin 3-like N-terminal domain-containing protein n=1 Tax=Sphaerobolus stellatus (strain SS14) TaxID=990650 RepID=A0A0C9UMK3_SPHS4|nr:hypothetical protein M422DRAFT_272415 [Sphaerobolus stellatus SS14]